MKNSFFFGLISLVTGCLVLGGCAGVASDHVVSSGRSGCNNIDMASADIRNDPANGLPPTPHH